MSLADGYTPLPPGKIASVVTYLEMRKPPEPLPPVETSGFQLEREPCIALDRYRALFRLIGQEWLWFSRLRMDDAQLSAIIHHPAVDVFVLRQAGADVGLLELDRRPFPEIELAFFGVTPALVGRGAGRQMMAVALREAWRRHPERFTVHTCTLDHPRAVAFYVKSGFVPVARAVEVSDDPRLAGETDPEAAAWFPVIGR
jgi:GNAT superfamily N-acetyltransferase